MRYIVVMLKGTLGSTQMWSVLYQGMHVSLLFMLSYIFLGDVKMHAHLSVTLYAVETI